MAHTGQSKRDRALRKETYIEFLIGRPEMLKLDPAAAETRKAIVKEMKRSGLLAKSTNWMDVLSLESALVEAKRRSKA